jgi:thiamine biosynthesis protein ThiS
VGIPILSGIGKAFKFDYNGWQIRVSTDAEIPMPSTESRVIEIVVNGEPRHVPAGQTVVELVESLGLVPGRVAVELNSKIVRQPEWERTRLAAGARLEIVQFVGGG